MENILSRHCIDPDVLLYEHNVTTGELERTYTRSQFYELIDRWKIFLVEKYNVQPGQTIAIELWPGLQYYSLIFAAAELGLIFIIDWPLCYAERDLTDYKVTMYGQIDYMVIHSDHHRPGHPKSHSIWTIERNLKYGKTLIYEDMLYEYNINQCKRFNEISTAIRATPNSDLIYTCSSGTTGLPKKIAISHKKIYLMSQRMALLNFTKNTSVLHYKNLHHGASIGYHFLPSFMVGGKLFTANGINGESEAGIGKVIKFAVENKITQLFLYKTSDVMYFLENMPAVDYTINIVTLFQITPDMLSLIKEKSVNYIRSMFGDNTIGIGFFAKHVDQTTDPTNYDVTNMGPVLDDFYQIELQDGSLYVASQILEQDLRTSDDKFDLIDGEYYFKGRSSSYRIGNEWIALIDIEKAVTQLFGPKGANIVIDFDWQKIYLAIWEPNESAEIELNKFFDNNYKEVKISYVLRDEKYNHFYSSRKIDNSKIRAVCRERLNNKEEVK